MASMVGFDLWMYMDAYHYDINDVRMCVYIRIYIYTMIHYIYMHIMLYYIFHHMYTAPCLYIYIFTNHVSCQANISSLRPPQSV